MPQYYEQYVAHNDAPPEAFWRSRHWRRASMVRRRIAWAILHLWYSHLIGELWLSGEIGSAEWWAAQEAQLAQHFQGAWRRVLNIMGPNFPGQGVYMLGNRTATIHRTSCLPVGQAA